MRIKKVLHINGMRELTNGQRQQLNAEYLAASKLEDVEWDILAYHNGTPEKPFERKFPLLFRIRPFRSLFIWLNILYYKNDYDLVLVRHLMFDPFSLIFPYFIDNRISIHHSKEIEELKLIRKGWKGNLASIVEAIAGTAAIRHSLAVIGVTEDISLYQNSTRGLRKETFTYSNGIDVNSMILAEDNRHPNDINIAFVCSYFSSWHGLDLLIDAINTSNLDNIKLKIHLVGNLNDEQKKLIEGNKYFQSYGYLDQKSYMKVLSKCDVALGSLALYRQNMIEGSTLKVRDMLAAGLPVYSTHQDTALKSKSKFYYFDQKLNISSLLTYCNNMKQYSRLEVREETKQYIDKHNILLDLIRKLDKHLTFLA